MEYGLLLIRVVFGLSLAAHGTQKLFGWFGGPGLHEAAAGFGRLGYRPPLPWALMACVGEIAGGVLFAAGVATPFAALVMAVVMINAIVTVHGAKGFWLSNGGYEYNLAILAVALGVAATGPGRFSLDALVGWDVFSGSQHAIAVAGAATVLSALTLTFGRTRRIAAAEGHRADPRGSKERA